MGKIVKSVKKVAASKSTKSASAVSPAAVAPVSAAVASSSTVVAPAPAVVATMADPAVKECNSLLEQVVTKLGDQTPLNADQIRRATKMRKGGAEVIPKILALCEQQGITQIGSLTTQEMSDELQRGDALLQVGLRSGVVQKKVRESAMAAHGRSWQIGTTMYTTLQRLAVNDPELALGLEPIQSFFQTKRTKGLVRANKKARAAKKVAKAPEVAPLAATESVASEPAVAPVAAPPPAVNGTAPASAAPANGAPAAPAPVAANGAN